MHSLQDDGAHPGRAEEDVRRRLDVEFYDVWENPDAGKKYGINVIPTQIFYDAAGKELFRHEGFFAKEDILAKWKEFGVDLTGPQLRRPAFSRLTPAQPETRRKRAICYMCDGDINPKTLVVVKTDKGDVRLVRPALLLRHVLLSDRGQDRVREEGLGHGLGGGQRVPLSDAVYLYGAGWTTGRPTIKAFAGRQAALPNEAGHRREHPGPGGTPAEGICPSLRVLRPVRVIRRTPPKSSWKAGYIPGAAARTAPWAWRRGPARTSRSAKRTA